MVFDPGNKVLKESLKNILSSNYVLESVEYA